MSLISNNLKYLRRINGLTQDQFARRIGTKRANVGAYEESRAVPPVDTLKIIANTFGITVDDFVKKDIRKLRETPDLTFEFEPKPFYSATPNEEIDPFDTPITQTSESKNMEDYAAPSIGDLMKKFLGDTHPNNEPKPIERVSQSVTLKSQTPNENPVFNTPPTPQNTYSQASNNNIQLVKRIQFSEYLNKINDLSFIKSLHTFNIPIFPTGEYRAFEAGEDFDFDRTLLIGLPVKHWSEILDSKNYILVTKSQGIIYRRVYNQVKIKGTLLLSTDNNRFPSSEISFTDVLETWEIKAFISQTLPEPTTPFNKLGNLVDEMKFELDRIKK